MEINFNHLFFRNNGLEVEPGETRLISSITLFAQDSDTSSSEVMFIFKSVPTQGLLQLKVGVAPQNLEAHSGAFRGQVFFLRVETKK